VFDQATLSGPNASSAGGTVTYTISILSIFRFSFFQFGFFSFWWWQPVADAGTVPVTNGSVPPSNQVTLRPGTYFWQASYSGDALNGASQSTQGAEAEIVIPRIQCPLGLGWLTVWCLMGNPGGNGVGGGNGFGGGNGVGGGNGFGGGNGYGNGGGNGNGNGGGGNGNGGGNGDGRGNGNGNGNGGLGHWW